MLDLPAGVVLSVDPAVSSPEDVLSWIQTLTAKAGDYGVVITGALAVTTALPTTATTGLPAALPTGVGATVPATGTSAAAAIAGQLARLAEFAPTFAARIVAVHEGMLALGYVPRLPRLRAGTTRTSVASYLSYIDPVSGRNFGNLNSERFYIVRADLREELPTISDAFEANGRYATCPLTSTDAVEALLKIAEREKK